MSGPRSGARPFGSPQHAEAVGVDSLWVFNGEGQAITGIGPVELGAMQFN
jgi:hypothetical protein